MFKDIYVSQSRKWPRHSKMVHMLEKNEKKKMKERKRKARHTHYKGLFSRELLAYGFKSSSVVNQRGSFGQVTVTCLDSDRKVLS